MNGANLRKRIGSALKKKSSGKRAAFLTDKKYHEEPEYAEAIPASRWHNIEMDWNGKRLRFQMNVNDHPLSSDEIRLGHVYEVDAENDEWVDAGKELLDAARGDDVLMSKLRSDIGSLESARRPADADESDELEQSSESEHVAEVGE